MAGKNVGYLSSCKPQIMFLLVQFFISSYENYVLTLLLGLKWNSCQKAAKALFVIEYEPNRVKA